MDKEKKKNTAVLYPVTDSDLDAVAIFLNQNMNSQFSPDVWKQGIGISWLNSAPNHGFMLKKGNDVVGVLCAIYSEQYINDTLVKFCNPHSWCVLPDFRTRSVDLVLSVIRQNDYHFTMFSPNESGIEIFSYLKFKPLDNSISILLNVPSINSKDIKITEDSTLISKMLPANQKKEYLDHKEFPWLKIVSFRIGGRCGFIIFKPQQYKKLPCAQIMYVSDIELFSDCWPALRRHLLFKYYMVSSKVESRFLKRKLGFTLGVEKGSQKFYRSDELTAENIRNIYSELVALDL